MKTDDLPRLARKRRGVLVFGFALVIGGITPGCWQTRRTPPAVGGSVYRVVEAPVIAAKGDITIHAEEAKVPIDALEPAKPLPPVAEAVYPTEARGRQKLPMLVGVRVTVGTDGLVADVGESPVAFSTPGPFATEFRVAVETAVRQWRFKPAELQHLVPKQGGPQGWYWQVTRVEKQDYTMDLQFTFTPSGEIVAEKR
ncbi:MAG: hypothetical protein V4773_20530 [Verrucomicrobiota bacterium]